MINKPRFRTKLKQLDPKTDIVPFLSVFFLLIMFFAITVTTVQVSGIKINLPSAGITDDFFAERCVVTVDKDDKVFWNDKLIKDIGVELGQEFNKIKSSNSGDKGSGKIAKSHTVVLRCDTAAEYKIPMEIMALAFANDINVLVALATEKKVETDYDSP